MLCIFGVCVQRGMRVVCSVCVVWCECDCVCGVVFMSGVCVLCM